MVTGFLFKVMREYSPSSSSLQQFLDDTSRKNYLRGKQCSLTELLGNILFYFIFALLLLGFFNSCNSCLKDHKVLNEFVNSIFA
jgi:hypothetical protein